MRWGIAIDLIRCINCYACLTACRQEHFLPMGMTWNRILISETGEYPNVRKQAWPIMCNHCKDAPCVDVCPTGATERREDGIVWVDADKCCGCRYCIIACPYQSRTYLSELREDFPGQGLMPYEEIGKKFYPHQVGTVEKCDYCMERIDFGLEHGLKPGIDSEATPACVIACETGARTFGDLDDPNSNVSITIKELSAQQFRPEYGTDPSTYYVIR